MADWQFRSARLVHTVVMLEFVPAGGSQPLSLALQIEQTNMLMVGLLGQLRAATQQGQRVDPLELAEGQKMQVAELPIDRWGIGEASDPSRALLHLQTPDGLTLAFGLDRRTAQSIGQSLISWAEEPST